VQYRLYNAGDQIWLSDRYGKQVVVKIVTHDGLTFSEEEPVMRRFSGVEHYLHLVKTFFIRGILRVLS
jgi:hypothetical protein